MLLSMLLSAEDSERLVRAAIASLPDEDPVLIALTFGLAAGHENAAFVMARGLAAFPDGGLVRQVLGEVCDEADRLAAVVVKAGFGPASVPSREVRMAGRPWLREGFEF